MRTFCYWSVADGEHAKMAATMVASARFAGVTTDFHIWTDLQIQGAYKHPITEFKKDGCWFKIDYLLNQASQLDYDYLVWLDADHYFVRKPRDIMEHVDNGLVMIPMENEITSPETKIPDWWGVPIQSTVSLFREFGCKNRRLFNTNGGLFIVRRDFIKSFCQLCYDFRDIIKAKGWTVPEEYCLAIIGNLFNKDLTLSSMRELADIWACDWVGVYESSSPVGDPWLMKNYLTGVDELVNPAIVHCMRGKKWLVADAV